MKKFMCGLLVGVTLSITLPTFATIQQYILTKATYPIIVDGVEFNDPDYPVLNYNGTTYLSLRKTAEAVGADLNWNEVKKQVEIVKKADDKEYVENKEQDALKSLINKYGEDTLNKRDADEFPVGARETLLKFQMVYYKSNVLAITDKEKRALMKYNEEYYIPINIISSYMSNEGTKYYIELPGQNSILIRDNKTITENAFKDGETYVKLSSIGLKPRIEGDVCWIEE